MRQVPSRSRTAISPLLKELYYIREKRPGKAAQPRRILGTLGIQIQLGHYTNTTP